MSGALFDLAGRVALVTGGSKGLGKAIARGYAEAGADVVIASRTEDELKPALEEILEGLDVRGAYQVADLTRRDEAKRLADFAEREMGRVDILLNNAGTNVPQAADEITDEVWNDLIELNLSSCMALTRAVVPGMKERGWGRIIHMSSILGYGGVEGRTAYSATKAALIGMARSSALELGPHGITVNCLAPGLFMTDLPRRRLSEEQKRASAELTAVGRWGDPPELVGPALMLAGEAGSYVTGATFVIDGGILCRTF